MGRTKTSHGMRPRKTLALAVVLGGAAWAWVNGVDLNRVYATKSWPTVPGRITSASVTNDLSYYIGRGGPGSQPRFHLAYAYTVNAREYLGSRIDLSPIYEHTAAWHEQRRYPAGSTVTVHYDAGDPSQSVLDTRLPFWQVLQVVVGVLAFVCGLFLVRRA